MNTHAPHAPSREAARGRALSRVSGLLILLSGCSYGDWVYRPLADASDVQDTSDLGDDSEITDAEDVTSPADIADVGDASDVMDARDGGDVTDARDVAEAGDVRDAADVPDCGVMLDFFRDLDGDGFGAPGIPRRACSALPGYVTNNLDCCDSDPRALPDGGYQDAPSDCGTYDFNCNGNDDREYTSAVTSCPSTMLACLVAQQGWETAPAPSCGRTARFVACGWSSSVCLLRVTDRVQRCR